MVTPFGRLNSPGSRPFLPNNISSSPSLQYGCTAYGDPGNVTAYHQSLLLSETKNAIIHNSLIMTIITQVAYNHNNCFCLQIY